MHEAFLFRIFPNGQSQAMVIRRASLGRILHFLPGLPDFLERERKEIRK